MTPSQGPFLGLGKATSNHLHCTQNFFARWPLSKKAHLCATPTHNPVWFSHLILLKVWDPTLVKCQAQILAQHSQSLGTSPSGFDHSYFLQTLGVGFQVWWGIWRAPRLPDCTQVYQSMQAVKYMLPSAPTPLGQPGRSPGRHRCAGGMQIRCAPVLWGSWLCFLPSDYLRPLKESWRGLGDGGSWMGSDRAVPSTMVPGSVLATTPSLFNFQGNPTISSNICGGCGFPCSWDSRGPKWEGAVPQSFLFSLPQEPSGAKNQLKHSVILCRVPSFLAFQSQCLHFFFIRIWCFLSNDLFKFSWFLNSSSVHGSSTFTASRQPSWDPSPECFLGDMSPMRYFKKAK